MASRGQPSQRRMLAAFLGAGPIVGSLVVVLAFRLLAPTESGPASGLPVSHPAWSDRIGFWLVAPVGLWLVGMMVGGLAAGVTLAYAWGVWRPMRRRIAYVGGCVAVGWASMAATTAVILLATGSEDRSLSASVLEFAGACAGVGVCGAVAAAVAALLTLPPRLAAPDP